MGAGNYSVTVTDDSGQIHYGAYTLYSSCYNVLEGYIFEDLNSNCISDSGETPLLDVYVTASNGSQSYYGNADANGKYSINIPAAGTYTVSAYSYNWGYGSCGNLTPCGGNTVTFSSVGDTSSENNFTNTSTGNHDLGIYATWSGANPGFQMHFNLYPYDFSSTQFTGLEYVTFQYDPQLVFDSSNNAQVANNSLTHTLSWVGANVPSWFFGGTPITCYFTVPVTTPTNYIVQSDFYISPVINDCDTSNNHLHTSDIVTGSFDPNEKTVSPAGNISTADSVLTYNIHFQNTGNDTTHFVIVTDTLPSALDPTTVVNLAASAPFSEFSVSGAGVLKWVFNPMFLPDSATNEPASKGFVMFKIKVKPNLPFGTTINNKASIYFDYNPAVITNYATNSIINGVEELTVNSEQLIVYPNPATDQLTIFSNKQSINTLVITDVLGRVIYSDMVNTKSANLNVSSFSAGVYFVKVQLQNGDVEVKRFVKE
ncbi:hypothetical protein LBMAG27_02470 [Bacteroidota bacterium]|nr:hypothetical protein LBMAG27_02470 [Bacteroidota bacterium]